jgi:hypothetical protein
VNGVSGPYHELREYELQLTADYRQKPKMHQRLADPRVNRINLRREFFYATPDEVKAHLLEEAGELLSYEGTAEALEYRQS